MSIGLALLKTARVETWDELITGLEAADQTMVAALGAVELGDDDLALLDAHLGLLSLIRVVPGSRSRSGHSVTVAVCDTCGRWMLSTGAVPRRCRLTTGCTGATVKSVTAKPAQPTAPHT